MKLKAFPAIIPFILFLISGCQKWNDNRETLTSGNHTLAEASFLYILHNALIGASAEGALLADSCFSLSWSDSSFPQTLTIDFGNTECNGLFDVPTRGKIIVQLSDSLNQPGAVAIVSTSELYIKGYKIEGTDTITNLGLNVSGNPEYRMKVTDGRIIAEPDETYEDYTLVWECDYRFELIDKVNEVFSIDDLYKITGSASGVNEEGRSYTAEIIEPLQKYTDCRWIGSGKTKISPDDLKEKELNYGECDTGSTCCDNIAIEEVRWTDRTVRMK
ncbi:MAG TPA: hypothetical protein VNJ07_06760 [Chitinophagales bacterium]|nr:hypothetical protein [Chitinophagales bacterium]